MARPNTPTTRSRNNLGKIIVLCIILVTIIIVAIVAACGFFIKKQDLIESRINDIAKDYYENFFYPNFSSTKGFQQIEDLDSAMSVYHEYGFSPVSLRQLLLYDNRKNAQYAEELNEYCDQDKTYVKYYIDSPYEKTSYHYDITYSCNY